ncbi:Sialin [Halotydeus destructor]|nr:Sialin [Halotydeus destructor]
MASSVHRIPVRYIVVLVALTANAVEYTLRSNLSITIVAMVKPPSLANATNSTNTIAGAKGEFDWSSTVQGMLLGSFFYGYIVTHMIGGHLSQYFGAKRLIAGSLLISSTLTLLSPVAAYAGSTTFIALRVVTGLAQGLMTPTLYTMFAHWIPVQERSSVLAGLVIGGNVGAVVTMPLSAYLCTAYGWQSVFYILGVIGCCCLMVWLYVAHDDPAKHPWMEHHELRYIQDNTDSVYAEKKSSTPVPWKSILLSYSVWATAMAKFAGSWIYYMLLTTLPTYLDTVHSLPIDQVQLVLVNNLICNMQADHLFPKINGNINALVYVAMSLALALVGYLSDTIERRRFLSKNVSRKLFETIALIAPAIGMLLVPYVTSNTTHVIVLIVVSLFFNGFYSGGDNPIVVDMAPDFSGVVYGFTSSIASTSGILAPMVIGLILDSDPGNDAMWNYAFYLATLINLIGAVVFVVFASAEPTPWGRLPTSPNQCLSKGTT